MLHRTCMTYLPALSQHLSRRAAAWSTASSRASLQSRSSLQVQAQRWGARQANSQPGLPCASQRRHACSASADGQAAHSGKRLFLYSKDDCPLCDGLKAKVQAVLDRAQFMPCALTGLQLEIRDITTREEWWQEYSLVIPVLTFADAGGDKEVKVPRPSPRISADRLQEHLIKAMAASHGES